MFLENLKKIYENYNQNIGLTIVYFEDGLSAEIRNLLDQTKKVIPKLLSELIVLDASFSRGYGLQTGIERTQFPDAILFLCDVDMIFTAEFLNRCATTTILNHQVYYYLNVTEIIRNNVMAMKDFI